MIRCTKRVSFFTFFSFNSFDSCFQTMITIDEFFTIKRNFIQKCPN